MNVLGLRSLWASRWSYIVGSWPCASRAQKRGRGCRQSLGVIHRRCTSGTLEVDEANKGEAIERRCRVKPRRMLAIEINKGERAVGGGWEGMSEKEGENQKKVMSRSQRGRSVRRER